MGRPPRRRPRVVRALHELGDFSIGRIGDDGFQGEADGDHRAHMGHRHAPFLAKSPRTGNARLRAMIVVEPRLRQVQLHRGQPRQRPGDQGRRHRHLTIGNLAERAAVLPLHPDRRRPLLRQAGVVDRQDPGAHRNHLAQPSPERTRLPRRMGDEVLQPLIRAGVAEPTMHRLHRFPVAVVQQSPQIPTGVGAVRAATEAGRELIEKRPEPRQQRARPSLRHASEGTESAVFVQVKLTK
jgi:hypothetical protein